jgi:hypothetical protein
MAERTLARSNQQRTSENWALIFADKFDLVLTSLVNKSDPTTNKDLYETPASLNQPRYHQYPWQRERWHKAINKELQKMEDLKVWKFLKKDTIPRGRRCVKHKWVFDIKQTGIFRARLVACGYIQIGGVDFTEFFSVQL